MSIRAIYKDGVFKPLEDVSVKEGTEVDVYPREERRNGKKPKSVFDLEFFGMWKNRECLKTAFRACAAFSRAAFNACPSRPFRVQQ